MTSHPLDALLDSIVRDVTAAKRARADLERRARIPVDADGYPPRASGAEPGSTTRASSRVNVQHDGTWFRWSCSCGQSDLAASESSAWATGTLHDCLANDLDYADPTGDAAVNSRTQPDPVAARWRRFQRLAERLARDARSLADQTVEPDRLVVDLEREAFDSAAWCANHRDHGLMEPADARYTGKCRACYEYELHHGYPPPAKQVEYRHLHGRWKPTLDRAPKVAKLRRA